MGKLSAGFRLRSSVAAIVMPIMVLGAGTMALGQPALQLAESGQPNPAILQSEFALPPILENVGPRLCGDVAPAVLAADLYDQAESTAARDLVAQLLSVTSLPLNFAVLEAPVSQVAAVVLEQGDQPPRRVLLFSPAFLAEAKDAVARHDWRQIALIAHEAGHHLAGHSLALETRQSSDEDEADAFAGLVLAKYDVSFADLGRSLSARAGERAAPPHLSEALAAGWGRGAMEAGHLRAALLPFGQTPEAFRPRPKPEGGADPFAREEANRATLVAWMGELAVSAPQNAEAPRSNPRLPLPDPRALPIKFDRFVYDPLGLVNEKEIASLERDAMAYAKTPGVEIVTIVADNLHGYSAQDYAQIMLRQLSVGQRDLGNGAVVVVAPNEGSSAVALGAGLTTALTGIEGQAELDRRAAAFVEGLKQGADPRVPTVAMGLTEAAHAIMRHADIANADWSLRFPTLGAARRAGEGSGAGGGKAAAYDPAKDPALHKILRLRARLAPQSASAVAAVTPALEVLYGPGHEIATSEGAGFILLGSAQSAPLVAGHDYELTVRIVENSGAKPVLALISHEDVTPAP